MGLLSEFRFVNNIPGLLISLTKKMAKIAKEKKLEKGAGTPKTYKQAKTTEHNRFKNCLQSCI